MSLEVGLIFQIVLWDSDLPCEKVNKICDWIGKRSSKDFKKVSAHFLDNPTH